MGALRLDRGTMREAQSSVTHLVTKRTVSGETAFAEQTVPRSAWAFAKSLRAFLTVAESDQAARLHTSFGSFLLCKEKSIVSPFPKGNQPAPQERRVLYFFLSNKEKSEHPS